MDAIIASLVGLAGMLITGGFVWLRSEIVPRLDRMEELLRSQGERIARLEGRDDALSNG